MVFNRKPDGRSSDGAPQQQPLQPPPVNRVTMTPPPALPRQSTAVTIPSESVIGSDLTIEGQSITIRCRGSLRVNGTIQADVHSMQVVVGEQASIHGAVAADTVNVFGRVSGAILGSRVVLHPTASVEGDIHSQVLSIEQGASFDGRSRKVTDPKEIAPQLEPADHHGGPAATPMSPPHGSQASPTLVGNESIPRLYS